MTNRTPVWDRPGALGGRRGPECVLGSAQIWWVKVPLVPG